jgi:hypothetical protein
MPRSATSAAPLRTALAAVASARVPLGTGLAALILALLAHLLDRTDAAWDLSAWDDVDDEEYEYTPYPSLIRQPPIGRAPHAACIEAGLFPDWILPGVRNRGMRPLDAPTPPNPQSRPARAPPSRRPFTPFSASSGRPPTHALIILIS